MCSSRTSTLGCVLVAATESSVMSNEKVCQQAQSSSWLTALALVVFASGSQLWSAQRCIVQNSVPLTHPS